MDNYVSMKNLSVALIGAALIFFFIAPTVLAECPEGQTEVFDGSDQCILDPGSIYKLEIRVAGG